MSLTRRLLGGIALAASLAGCKRVNYIPQDVVTVEPDRYMWIDAGQQGDIKESFLHEAVSHNKVAWERYQMLVRKVQKEAGRENFLPDLDADGKVHFNGKDLYAITIKLPTKAEIEKYAEDSLGGLK